VAVGDWIALAALASGFLVYLLQRVSARREAIGAAISLLEALQNGMPTWSEGYFEGTYTPQTANARAQLDAQVIRGGDVAEVYLVPTQPLTALMLQGGHYIDRETIEAANRALWQIGVFNQLVQQLTDFNTTHLPDIRDMTLPAERREALAGGAYAISWLIHSRGIGPATWYVELRTALTANIARLKELRKASHWYSP
jgi:hypothetical protein